MHVLAEASIHEGETSWHCNSSGSNRIQLMTKLIEGLTPASPDKAALLCVCTSVSVLVFMRMCMCDVCAGFGCISRAQMMAPLR